MVFLQKSRKFLLDHIKYQYVIFILVFGIFVACVVLFKHSIILAKLSLFEFVWSGGYSGYSAAVYKDGEVTSWRQGEFFNSKLDLIEGDPIFPIASLSKPLTAAVILRMEAQGILNTSDGIYLSSAQTGSLSVKGFNVKDLLQHTSGLSPSGSADPVFGQHEVVGCKCALARESSRRNFTVQGVTIYSNLGYCMLGEYIESISKKSYRDAAIDILKLKRFPNITISYGNEEKNIVKGYLNRSDYVKLSAAGGWFADAKSLVQVFAENFLEDDRFDNVRVAGPAVDGYKYHYGKGWRVLEDESNIILHMGILPGIYTVAVVVKNKGVGVVMFNGGSSNPEKDLGKVKRILKKLM